LIEAQRITREGVIGARNKNLSDSLSLFGDGD
jgi:hypothetical protein